MNWVYIDACTCQLRYGIRKDAQHNFTGPFDCTRQSRRLTFQGWEGFCAVETEPGAWAVFFDVEDDGLQGRIKAGFLPVGERILEIELQRVEKKYKKDGDARNLDQTINRGQELDPDSKEVINEPNSSDQKAAGDSGQHPAEGGNDSQAGLAGAANPHSSSMASPPLTDESQLLDKKMEACTVPNSKANVQGVEEDSINNLPEMPSPPEPRLGGEADVAATSSTPLKEAPSTEPGPKSADVLPLTSPYLPVPVSSSGNGPYEEAAEDPHQGGQQNSRSVAESTACTPSSTAAPISLPVSGPQHEGEPDADRPSDRHESPTLRSATVHARSSVALSPSPTSVRVNPPEILPTHELPSRQKGQYLQPGLSREPSEDDDQVATPDSTSLAESPTIAVSTSDTPSAADPNIEKQLTSRAKSIFKRLGNRRGAGDIRKDVAKDSGSETTRNSGGRERHRDSHQEEDEGLQR